MTLARDLFSSLNRIAAFVGKEFLAMWMDKGSRIILIVPVLLQAVLFGYGATFNLDRVPWVLCDESHSALSSEVVRGLEGPGFFRLVASAPGLPQFTRAIDSGEAIIGLYFPSDFAKTGELMLACDARNSTTAGIAAGYVSSIAEAINARHGNASPLRVTERLRYNENNITRFAIMPALILALSMIQVLMLAGFSVSREREEGSFDMLLMTPANSMEILVGKAVIPILVACVQAFLIFAVGVFWFRLPFAGNLLTMGVFVLGFSISFVGIGLAVSAVANTIQQSMVLVMVIMLPSIILSGLFTSVLAMPPWMQTISVLNPLQYAIRALRALYFEGAGLADILPLFWPIGLTGFGSLAWAAWLFRHKIA